MFGGRQFRDVMHLSEISISIAGGAILFKIAFNMVFNSTESDSPNASLDLRQRAQQLAGALLQFCNALPEGGGRLRAAMLRNSGQKLAKFRSICEAQGGFSEPTIAPYARVVTAKSVGRIVEIGNRRLACIAKLADAPCAPTAGIDLHLRCGSKVEIDSPLFTLHTETPGELQYALDVLTVGPNIFTLAAA